MGALLERLTRQPLALWLDAQAYGARLLADGAAPWLDVAAHTAWQRKLQGLLKGDVLSLPVAEVIAAWLSQNPALKAAMAAKSRSVFPLKTLLADELLRAHLAELARALRQGLAGPPLVLVLPSPRAWLALAYTQAHGRETDVDEDAADSAALYLADFLQAFADAGVDGLLLQEAAHFKPASAQDFVCYQSLLNVAAHFRWDVGLHLHHPVSALPTGWAFAVAPQPIAGLPTVAETPSAFWSGSGHAGGAFRYAAIPADANPEAVLERLAEIRQD